MEIGKAIHRRRKALGLTASDLAERLATTHATVSRWENGKQKVKTTDLDLISKALQTTISELLGQENGNSPPNSQYDIDPLLLAAWKRLDRKSRKYLVQFALIMAGEAVDRR
jgi:transcriptional regulator with XRE-family HTH domain